MSNKSLCFFCAAEPGQHRPASACLPPPHDCCRCHHRIRSLLHEHLPALRAVNSATVQPASLSHTKRHQTIDPEAGDFVQILFGDETPFSYGAGMVTARPTCRRRGSSLGFAAISASTFTPYFRAMIVGVSPALMMCVRKVVAGVAGGRAALAEFDVAAPLAGGWPATDGCTGRSVGDPARAWLAAFCWPAA